MDQAWDRAHGPRPNTATVQVRELSWLGLHNPCPQIKDRGSHGGSQSQQLGEEHLAPTRLVSAGGAQATGACVADRCSQLHSVPCAFSSLGANPAAGDKDILRHLSHRRALARLFHRFAEHPLCARLQEPFHGPERKPLVLWETR